jgi:HSP20 family protein
MNIEQTIEQVEKLYQRIAGHEIPASNGAAFAPVNADVNIGQLLELRMTQLLMLLQNPAIQTRLQPWTPPVSIWEADEKITVCVELCGISKSDIDISVRDNFLIISGNRVGISAAATGVSQPRRLEIPSGPFQRVIALPPQMSTPEITSNLRDGILEIIVTKSDSKNSSANGSPKKGKGSLQ